MQKADLILHPVRLRILMALAGRRMTAKELATALPDVAPATLYRHINALAEGGVLVIVGENPVRGTIERVYTLAQNGANLTADDLAAMSRDDHLRLFTAFVTKLLNDFTAYLDANEHVDVAADGVSYRQAPLYLSDEELANLMQQAGALVMPYVNNPPAPQRRRRLLTTIIMPDETAPGE